MVFSSTTQGKKKKKKSYSKQPFFLPKRTNFENSIIQAMLHIYSEKSSLTLC